jgi:hypothetical protein
MKIVIAMFFGTAAFLLGMIGLDIFVHDQTFSEALKASPNQFMHSLAYLVLLAWNYKFVTLIAFGIATAIILVRIVPEIRNQH